MHQQFLQLPSATFMHTLHRHLNMDGYAANKLSTRCTSSCIQLHLATLKQASTGISTWKGQPSTAVFNFNAPSTLKGEDEKE
jgi:hypothetical protein